MNAIVVSHSPCRLQGGRWVAQFDLEFHDGRGVTTQQCLEPRLDLTFATRAEAIGRNRDLARRWRDDNAPGEELQVTQHRRMKARCSPSGASLAYVKILLLREATSVACIGSFPFFCTLNRKLIE